MESQKKTELEFYKRVLLHDFSIDGIILINSIKNGDRKMDWEFIAKYTPEFINAGILTLKIGGIGIILSIIVGILGSWILYENFKFFKQIVIGYVELSRNTPLLVQLFFLYFGLPKVGLGFAQTTNHTHIPKDAIFYNARWQGVATESKAAYYRVLTVDIRKIGR